MPSEQIIGALATAFVAVVGVLWREHLKADADDRTQRDRALGLLDLSLQNNRDAISAWAKRDDTDAARVRRSDR